MERVPATQLADWLLAHGRTAVSTDEAAALLGRPAGQVRVALHRQVTKQHIFSPSRGMWVPVPPEFRSWGATPALHFIDDMMRHLDRDYYVGWLSAAEVYSAAHQRPQVFQVAVNKDLKPRQVGRNRMRFITREAAGRLPRRQWRTPTRPAWIAKPELVAFDLVDEFRMAGGVNNAATVLTELCESPGLSTTELISLAARFPAATSRRLGYLLQLVEADIDLDGLLGHLRSSRRVKPVKLLPSGPVSGQVDDQWGIIVNTDVEPDL